MNGDRPATDHLHQIPNPSVAALYEDALVYETGTAITSSGALTAYSGKKTGRSPLDKRIVKEPTSEKDIWYVPLWLRWPSNQPLPTLRTGC
jgi:phosphoenolpyruvate carboxykinase (ATP)